MAAIRAEQGADRVGGGTRDGDYDVPYSTPHVAG